LAVLVFISQPNELIVEWAKYKSNEAASEATEHCDCDMELKLILCVFMLLLLWIQCLLASNACM